jgi:hypothetical protein
VWVARQQQLLETRERRQELQSVSSSNLGRDLEKQKHAFSREIPRTAFC